MASNLRSKGGGVDRVTLMPRIDGGDNPPFVEIEVIRGRSSYVQELSREEGMPLYTHTLEVVTPIAYDIFEDKALGDPMTQGVRAQVKLTCGESILLGWEESDQPLRLVESSATAEPLSATSAEISHTPSPVKYWKLRAYSTSAVL